MEGGANQKTFDVFVRNYDDNKPMITLTVSGATTIGKLKKQFAELCKWLFVTFEDSQYFKWALVCMVPYVCYM